jgi:hypothetical protein
VPHSNIEVQVAVLVGGYKDQDAARRDLDRIKKLPEIDPRRIKLPGMMLVDKHGKSAAAPVNPFMRAFVVTNPAVQQGRTAGLSADDLALLRSLNEGEKHSLLNCPRPFTLVVKHFPLPAVLEQRSAPTGGLLGKLGLGSSSSAKQDTAAHNARELVEMLRHLGWEAYVLHTRFYSMVAVGGYESRNDPRLTHDQQLLATQVNPRLARVNPGLQLFAQAVPIPVPR